MILGDRSLYDLSLDDFRALVDNHEAEGPHLEYKASAYSGKGDEIREMLRDITALANAEGGYLVMGIQEDVAGHAANLSPIENSQTKVQAINQACLDGIQERIPGLEVRAYETGLNRGIIVVHVPASNQRPHMMAREHRTDFYCRYGTDKRPMTLPEIMGLILDNPRFQRLLELELIAKGYTLSETSTGRAETPYIQIFTERVVEHFVKRYLISSARAQALLILSPFISDLSGELYNLQNILERAIADKTRVYVVTRPPKEKYQHEAMAVLQECPYVEIRYNSDIHAKLYVCWCRSETESFALFGSGNLTAGGLRYNLELGMMILARGHGQNLVGDLYQWGSFSVRSISQRVKSITT